MVRRQSHEVSARMGFTRKWPKGGFDDQALRAARPTALPDGAVAGLGVVAAVAAAGVAESRAERVTTCGPPITVQDPDVRASLARFDRHQSAGARKVCTIYRDWH
jgi:hypothetical protein